MCGHTVTTIFFPGLVSLIIDKGISSGNLELTFQYIGLFILNGISMAIFQYSARVGFAKISQDILLKIKSKVFFKLMQTNLAFWNKHKIGDVASILESDINKVESLLTTAFCDAAVNVLVVLGMSCFLLYIDFVIGTTLIILAALFVCVQRKAGEKIRKNMTDVRSALGEASSLTNEILNNMQSIQIIGFISPFFEKYQKCNNVIRDYYVKYVSTISESSTITNLYSVFSMLTVLTFGALSIVHEQMAFGTILTLILYAQRLYTPINSVCNTYVLIKNISPSVHKIMDVIQSEDMIFKGALDADNIKGRLTFNNVFFRYDKSNDYILENFNLDIMPGDRVGIVGRNGSGKTTIIKLLCGLCIPEKGNICIDDIELGKYDLDLLKSQVGFTLQKDYLVSGRLSEILSFGLEDTYLDNKNRLIEAFQLDINKFKNGWETFINENSINISGGEMQKISLIRMFSSSKNVYVLDEPTSFMDFESEKKACLEMKKLLVGKTAIIITHRPQILDICNRIINLDELG